jgi:hypothetical protein
LYSQFNGAAGTTNCQFNSLNAYGDKQGVADVFNVPSDIEIGETTVLVSKSFVETNDASTNINTQSNLAGFLHRPDQKSAPVDCTVRARLTPSAPSVAGSMWFKESAPVSNGFDTFFTFQITDHSKQCTQVCIFTLIFSDLKVYLLYLCRMWITTSVCSTTPHVVYTERMVLPS